MDNSFRGDLSSASASAAAAAAAAWSEVPANMEAIISNEISTMLTTENIRKLMMYNDESMESAGHLDDAAVEDSPEYRDGTVGRWTREEHLLFIRGLELYGKGWKKIAGLIKTRTVVQIRTHAQKYFLKLTKARQNGETSTVVAGDRERPPGMRKKKKKRKIFKNLAIAPILQPYVTQPVNGATNSEGLPLIDVEESIYNFLSPPMGYSFPTSAYTRVKKELSMLSAVKAEDGHGGIAPGNAANAGASGGYSSWDASQALQHSMSGVNAALSIGLGGGMPGDHLGMGIPVDMNMDASTAPGGSFLPSVSHPHYYNTANSGVTQSMHSSHTAGEKLSTGYVTAAGNMSGAYIKPGSPSKCYDPNIDAGSNSGMVALAEEEPVIVTMNRGVDSDTLAVLERSDSITSQITTCAGVAMSGGSGESGTASNTTTSNISGSGDSSSNDDNDDSRECDRPYFRLEDIDELRGGESRDCLGETDTAERAPQAQFASQTVEIVPIKAEPICNASISASSSLEQHGIGEFSSSYSHQYGCNNTIMTVGHDQPGIVPATSNMGYSVGQPAAAGSNNNYVFNTNGNGSGTSNGDLLMEKEALLELKRQIKHEFSRTEVPLWYAKGLNVQSLLRAAESVDWAKDSVDVASGAPLVRAGENGAKSLFADEVSRLNRMQLQLQLQQYNLSPYMQPYQLTGSHSHLVGDTSAVASSSTAGFSQFAGYPYAVEQPELINHSHGALDSVMGVNEDSVAKFKSEQHSQQLFTETDSYQQQYQQYQYQQYQQQLAAAYAAYSNYTNQMQQQQQQQQQYQQQLQGGGGSTKASKKAMEAMAAQHQQQAMYAATQQSPYYANSAYQTTQPQMPMPMPMPIMPGDGDIGHAYSASTIGYGCEPSSFIPQLQMQMQMYTHPPDVEEPAPLLSSSSCSSSSSIDHTTNNNSGSFYNAHGHFADSITTGVDDCCNDPHMAISQSQQDHALLFGFPDEGLHDCDEPLDFGPPESYQNMSLMGLINIGDDIDLGFDEDESFDPTEIATEGGIGITLGSGDGSYGFDMDAFMIEEKR